jgi:hypothetical protein
MSQSLLEFAKQFARGRLRADDFTAAFMERWKQERDSRAACNDPPYVSECLSTVFCLADLYNSDNDREPYELDEAALRERVGEAVGPDDGR